MHQGLPAPVFLILCHPFPCAHTPHPHLRKLESGCTSTLTCSVPGTCGSGITTTFSLMEAALTSNPSTQHQPHLSGLGTQGCCEAWLGRRHGTQVLSAFLCLLVKGCLPSTSPQDVNSLSPLRCYKEPHNLRVWPR